MNNINVLKIIREWIQWYALNGSTVTWGSEEILKLSRPLTVGDLERLALEIEERIKKG